MSETKESSEGSHRSRPRRLPDVLSGLTEEQLNAITYLDGPLLVVAGAGTGKTRVITRRVAYLLALGVPSRNILAITFTNKAADEMRGRVERMCGQTDAWIRTFHSMCTRILRREIHRLGFSSSFSIFDAADSSSCLKRVIKKLELDAATWRPSVVWETIRRAKNSLVSPDEFAETASGMRAEVISKVYSMYQSSLREQNALDFDDLIAYTVRLFETHPEVLELYRTKFQHVLIDEYQDTNWAQFQVSYLLTGADGRVCAVGDADQAIYRWRGAQVENMLQFSEHYPTARVFRLEQNFRSTKTILAVASDVIRRNELRHPRELWTGNPGGNPLRILRCRDEMDEARVITAEISKLRAAGTPLSEMAVFYRTNAQSRPIEQALITSRIPYCLVESVEFFQRAEIKDLLAYLRLVANPVDETSLLRIINSPRRQIGDGTVELLREGAEAAGSALWEAVTSAQELKRLGKKSKAAVAAFAGLMRQLMALPRYPVADLVREVIEETRYLDWIEKNFPDRAEDKSENVQEMVSAAGEYDARNPGGSLDGFLEQVALIADADRYNGSRELVNLMTLHTAKGLEFSVVFLSGVEQGLLPHRQSMESMEELEEERRLFYVGLTRAKKHVIILHAALRAVMGELMPRMASAFLADVPRNLVVSEDSDLAVFGAAPERDGFWERPEQAEEIAEGGLKSGDLVRHGTFGPGRILEVSEGGRKARVRFSGGDEKTLVLRYAGLERLDESG